MISLEKEYKYLFSIVIPIYNVEEYLDEAIESIINQSLSFERHVQIILINDGSSDDSGTICLKYAHKYPNNIRYISKEHEGVSIARNTGLELVEGKYVNFLDPDDKLSSCTLYEVYKFFEMHYEEIDIVSIPMIMFERKSGEHPLNYKFKSSRVIDLLNEFKCIQMSAASSFFKSYLFTTNGLRFDINMEYAEDARLVNMILLEKNKLGVVTEATYHYRIRQKGTSAIQNGQTRKEWFINNLYNFSFFLINYAQKKIGFVPEYIQFAVMYDLKWRFSSAHFDDVLDTEEKEFFVEQVKKLLFDIEDKIILSQFDLNVHRKIFALRLKNKGDFKYIFTNNNVELYYRNKIIDSMEKQAVNLSIIEVKENTLSISGSFGSLFNNEDINMYYKFNGKFNKIKDINESNAIYSFGKIVKKFIYFNLSIPLTDLQNEAKIQFYNEISGNFIPVILRFPKKTSKLSDFKSSFYVHQDILVFHKDNKIYLKKIKTYEKLIREVKFLKELFKSKQVGSKKAVLARIAYRIAKIIKGKKEIWLFMDRRDKSDDNAEHLFKYAINKKDRIKKIFVINRSSMDYKRIKKIGPVISWGSYRYKIMHLLSDKVISSHAEEWVDNPFFSLEKYYRDLINFDFVFLQHGITKDDVSKYLNKHNKNFKMFVSSTPLEFQSLMADSYGFKTEVKLTGLPRFDNLKNNSKRQIVIMPTWRSNLVHSKNILDGTRQYNESFKDSVYFKVLDSLINDRELIAAAQKKGYRIVFVPHPEIRQQVCDFTKNDYVEFADYDISYQKLFNESDMLITDYSSVAFDFGYLKKPVIYYHFDNNHYEKGYFDYKLMGFGEVVNDQNSIIQLIVEYIRDDCKMKEFYQERVNQFFAFTDNKNCERVYNEIIEL